MKKNLPITDIEQSYPAHERLISETDLKGILTIANASFCSVSGFTAAELVGKSHNIVRHPDMPPEAFADLWRTIQAGERWTGLVKNRCKNGDHYWVEAFISPVFQGNQIVRYRSVRKQPTREAIANAEKLYARMRAGETGLIDTLATIRRQQGLADRLGFGGQLALIAGLPLLVTIAVLIGSTLSLPLPLLWGVAGGGAVATGAMAWLVHGWLTRPLTELARAVGAFERGDLSARVAITGRSQFGQIAGVMNRALDGVEVALADMGQMLDGLARGEFLGDGL